jgi:hypothetical protein
MLQSLFPRLGWGWSVRALGFTVLGICGCANFLIRSRLPPAQGASARPDFNIFRNRAFTLTTLGSKQLLDTILTPPRRKTSPLWPFISPICIKLLPWCSDS